MARALLYHERQNDASWKPVGTFYATRTTLDAKVLPGSASRDAWVKGITGGKPPYKDGIGLSPERGTWEDDWCDYALDSLSNGHDTWMTEVEPEPTLEATYRKWVLGAPGIERQTVATTEEVPELSGYKKVAPK